MCPFDQPTSVRALTQLCLAAIPKVEKRKTRKKKSFYPVAIPATDQINTCAQDDDLLEKLSIWIEE